MKGIFIFMVALCLGACASQPEKAVTAHQPSGKSAEQIQPADVANAQSSDRVHLHDYQLVPFQAPAQRRGVRVLGTKKG